jgi:intron-binding protein aquarius
MANKEDGLPLISKLFPFTSYFSNAPQPIFKGQTFDEDWEIAQGCFRHIDKIFKQLEVCTASNAIVSCSRSL